MRPYERILKLARTNADLADCEGAFGGGMAPSADQAWIYMIPNSFKIMRMITMTSKTCTTLPLRGKPEKRFGPKYPSNHSMSRITIIQVSIRFLLLSDLFYNSSYNKSSPAASIGRGVLFSASWGRWSWEYIYSARSTAWMFSINMPSRHFTFAENSDDRQKNKSVGAITTTWIS